MDVEQDLTQGLIEAQESENTELYKLRWGTNPYLLIQEAVRAMSVQQSHTDGSEGLQTTFHFKMAHPETAEVKAYKVEVIEVE